MVATLVCAALLAGCQGPAPDDEGTTIEGFEWGFSPDSMDVPLGEEVTIEFRNAGSVAHNLGGDFGRTDTIQSEETDTLTVQFDEPGEYAFWCAVSGHRDAGMEGTFVVTA